MIRFGKLQSARKTRAVRETREEGENGADGAISTVLVSSEALGCSERREEVNGFNVLTSGFEFQFTTKPT